MESGAKSEDIGGGVRGEMLEKEIWPINGASFAAFFDSTDPVAEGLPVGELIERVAERYAMPTNGQIRTRLIVAAAFQRAFNKLRESQGELKTVAVCAIFGEIYRFLVELEELADSKEEVLTLFQAANAVSATGRTDCEWLYNENCWERLPIELQELFNRPE